MAPNAKKPIDKDAYTRREALGLMTAAAAAIVTGCGPGRSGAADSLARSGSPTAAAVAAIPACVTRPQQTEGPYFIDEKLNRSDIRSDPKDGSVRPGVPLRLAFHVAQLDKRGCTALPGAVVDVWQCDALGVYSDFRDLNGQFDTSGQKFLRGYQVTGKTGIAEFLTIYPGWYSGRAVHIHFKIRAQSPNKKWQEFTSQLYFDESITDRVHARPPYNIKGKRNTTNESDLIFRRGGSQLLLRLVPDGHGYTATFDIGLELGSSRP